jgi:hypothetical protein
MINEKNKENGCRIFCIYFKHKNNSLDSVKENGENILKEIAELGQTEHHYNSNSLISLCNTFKLINEAIQTNYKLKLQK